MSDRYTFPVDLHGVDIEPHRPNWTNVKAEGFQGTAATVVSITDDEVEIQFEEPTHPMYSFDKSKIADLELVTGFLEGAPARGEVEAGADPDSKKRELVELTLRKKQPNNAKGGGTDGQT